MRFRSLIRALIVIGAVFCFFIAPLQAFAQEGGEYLLKFEEKYKIFSYKSGEYQKIAESESVSELICGDFIQSGARVFLSGVSINEELEIKNNITLSGSARVFDCDLVITGADVAFSAFRLEFEGEGGVRLKEGSLSIEDSRVISETSAGVRLDFSAKASLEIIDSEIKSDSLSGAIYQKFGTARLESSIIENSKTSAIKNESSLYLGKDNLISGSLFDIESDATITLVGYAEFKSGVKIKFNTEFEKGTLSELVYGADAESADFITIFDKYGNENEARFFEETEHSKEKNFLSVFKPYLLKQYKTDGSFLVYEFLAGEKLSPIIEEISGYKFLGFKDSFGELVNFENAHNSDISVYPEYQLSVVAYSINSLNFVYDGKTHELSFSSVSHPLIEEGELSYLWYKNGECISSSNSVKLKSAADSGEYICKLKFTHNGNESVIETKPVAVKIQKAKVDLPEILPKSYTGAPLYANVPESIEYSFISGGGVGVGKYPVTLKLRDSENYEFSGFSEDEITLNFEILPAENEWVKEPSIDSFYSGESVSLFAKSKFGQPTFLFSESYSSFYTESFPTKPGRYFMKAVVSATENYLALESGIFEFYVFEDELVGLAVEGSLVKDTYSAFESFSPDGISLVASYASGRVEKIGAEQISVKYPRGDFFLFGDNYVILSFGGMERSLSVKVEKARYELSGFEFSDITAVYDGTPYGNSIDFPNFVGKDGIALEYFITGFSANAGEYEICLNFKTASENYSTPLPMYAHLSVLPLPVDVFFESTEAVYNGKLQAPRAYFINENGIAVYLSVKSSAVSAGKYTVFAECESNNYELLGAEAEFEILKADYDLTGVYWTKSEFVYNGFEQGVFLLGLPSGVSVIGYLDNLATDAGTYYAKAAFDYDRENYNEPQIEPFLWTVRRAEYELSGFRFSDFETTFDGNEHYPLFEGEMPTGLDGIKLGFHFVGGVTHVADGRALVRVIFTTESKNYNAPKSVEYFVKINPRPISVVWQGEEFVYSGELQAPRAFASETSIFVFGGVRDAGVHIARAVSASPDYFVVNETFEFEIKRAENAFIYPPYAESFYEGEEPKLFAETLSGDVSFRYFKDRECKEEIEAPFSAGIYYAIAESLGGANFTEIRSEVIEFSVTELVPTSISAELKVWEYKAFMKLSPDDVKVSVEYNSGLIRELEFSEYQIIYQNADSLRASDSSVNIIAFGLNFPLEISVSKADFDVSKVYWSESCFIYDGEKKNIELLDLPSGIEVLYYRGGDAVFAGEYPVEAVLSYDRENYNPPKLPEGVIKIEKRVLEIPEIPTFVYTGRVESLVFDSSELFEFSNASYLNAGVYSVRLWLSDKDNYTFSGGEESVTVRYQVLPMEIEIRLSDIELYRFEKPKKFDYEIVSENYNGEELNLSFVFDGEKIKCYSRESNYKITLTGGEIIKHDRLSRGASILILISLFFFVLCFLIVTSFFINREKFRRLSLIKEKEGAKDNSDSLKFIEPFKKTDFEITRGGGAYSEIDEKKADEILSDFMARALIKQKESIKSFGNRKSIVNVGTLSTAFSSGERVDINSMKKENLVPRDSSYVKVLAGGIIDKPLSVYANDFSLSAVKMIALMGGEAIKVETERVRIEDGYME